MFSIGLTPPTDVSHDISNCLTCLQLVPDSESFLITTLQLCGTSYTLDTQFLSQSELLTFLNGTFNDTYEYTGVWTIESNHLIYTDHGECEGENCVTILTNYRITDDYQLRLTDNLEIRNP